MQTGQLVAPNANQSNARTFNYTAIGASDAVGVGASSPCTTAAVVIGPDTEQMPSPPSCPGGTGYVPVIARVLTSQTNTVNLTDLGISGAVIGPTERTLGNMWEPFLDPTCGHPAQPACIPGAFIADELPLIPSQQNTVTIFAGGNDTIAIFAHVAVACSACTPQQIVAMVTNDIVNFGADYSTLLTAVHSAFPFARIYVANLPNLGLIPRGVCIGSDPANPPPFCDPVNDPAQNNPAAQLLLDQISVGIDSGVINGPVFGSGIPVIDLECTAALYDPANFSPDGFHPDDSGYALFAQKFAAAIRIFGASPPAGSCGAFSQGGPRRPFNPRGLKRIKLARW